MIFPFSSFWNLSGGTCSEIAKSVTPLAINPIGSPASVWRRAQKAEYFRNTAQVEYQCFFLESWNTWVAQCPIVPTFDKEKNPILAWVTKELHGSLFWNAFADQAVTVLKEESQKHSLITSQPREKLRPTSGQRDYVYILTHVFSLSTVHTKKTQFGKSVT